MEKAFLILLLASFVSTESLQCFVCTDCETNYEYSIQRCQGDGVITSTSQPDLTTTDESVITSTDPPATAGGDDSDVSTQTTTEQYDTTTESASGGMSSTTEGINTSPSDVDITTEAENKSPTDLTTESASGQETTIAVENNNNESATLEETLTSIGNHEEIIQEPPTMFTADVKESSTVSETNEPHTFTTPDIINVQTTPSLVDTSTVTEKEYSVQQMDYSSTLASIDETTTLSDIDDIEVGEKSDSKLNYNQPPQVQMVDENKKYGSRYAFIRTIREVKNNVQSRPHCVVTSYQDQNRTVVVRGCSSVQEDDPMKHCYSLLGAESGINLTRCMVCDQHLCNSASKTMASLMFLMISLFIIF